MALTIAKRNARSIQLRTTQSNHETESGVYNIGEIAYVETIEDKDYVHSVGFAFRSDPVSEELRKLQDAEDVRRRQARDRRAVAEASLTKTEMDILKQEAEAQIAESEQSGTVMA